MKAIVFAVMGAVVAVAGDLPRKAPDVEITLQGGKKITLEQYRGKVVCLTFILTT